MRSTRVQDPEQLARVEHLRVELRRRGLWPSTASAGGAPPLRADPVDQCSHHWLAWDGNDAVGAIRASWGVQCDLRQHHPEYELDPFINAVGAKRLVVSDQLMILPEYRSGLASPMLMKEVVDFTLGHGIDVAFCDCDPSRVPLFESLGFRLYGAVAGDISFGTRVPMVLVLSDRGHLIDIGSPLRNRLPESIPSEVDPALARLVESRCLTAAPIRSRVLAPRLVSTSATADANRMAGTVTPACEDELMAFGESKGYPASHRQVQQLTELIRSAGHTDFRDARGPLGLTQRQAGGKFTKDEAEDLIAQLEAAAEDGAPPSTSAPLPTDRRQAKYQAVLEKLPTDLLAAELQSRGWIVMEP